VGEVHLSVVTVVLLDTQVKFCKSQLPQGRLFYAPFVYYAVIRAVANDLEKIRPSLNTPCPHCGHEHDPGAKKMRVSCTRKLSEVTATCWRESWEC